MMVELWLMDKILHDPKDPKLWELWYIPYYGSCRILSINRMAYLENLECGRCGEFRESLGSLNEFAEGLRDAQGLGFCTRITAGKRAVDVGS